jgi:hypothetical protein
MFLEGMYRASSLDVLSFDKNIGGRLRPKEAGTETAWEWPAKTFPDILGSPLCPQPLQSGLKSPPRRADKTEMLFGLKRFPALVEMATIS